jgi:hypothetical protein
LEEDYEEDEDYEAVSSLHSEGDPTHSMIENSKKQLFSDTFALLGDSNPRALQDPKALCNEETGGQVDIGSL